VAVQAMTPIAHALLVAFVFLLSLSFMWAVKP
jgi:hypothetical protein